MFNEKMTIHTPINYTSFPPLSVCVTLNDCTSHMNRVMRFIQVLFEIEIDWTLGMKQKAQQCCDAVFKLNFPL